MNTVVGLYDPNDAQHAMEVLETYGVDHDQINVIARDINMIELDVPAYAFTAPEFGQVIATGELGSQLFVTLQNKTTSSLSDALIDTGFSEVDAELFVEGVKRGDILVSVED